MYQCMAYNDLDTRYSSGQLRVLGDDDSKEKWRPSFAKHPLEEKMYAAKGGNITIKYAHNLSITTNICCHLNWLLSRRDLCLTACHYFPSSQTLPSKEIQKLNEPKKSKLHVIYPTSTLTNTSSGSLISTKYWSSYLFDQLHIVFSGSGETPTTYKNCFPFMKPKTENGWNFYRYLPSWQFLFNLDISLFFQPLVMNLFMSKCALKVFAKVFLKNYFGRQVYKRYFKVFFKMLFRNLPKACIKLFFKYSFKVVLNILAKLYFCIFLIYLISKRKQRTIK